jgi:hypothetical protein
MTDPITDTLIYYYLWSSGITGGQRGWRRRRQCRFIGVVIDVNGLKWRGGERRSWVRVDAATGDSEVVDVTKPALMRHLDLLARDLRLLDPLFIYPVADLQ